MHKMTASDEEDSEFERFLQAVSSQMMYSQYFVCILYSTLLLCITSHTHLI